MFFDDPVCVIPDILVGKGGSGTSLGGGAGGGGGLLNFPLTDPFDAVVDPVTDRLIGVSPDPF